MIEHWINRRHRKDIVTIVRTILHILDMDGVKVDEFDDDLINRIAGRVYQDFYGKNRYKISKFDNFFKRDK